MKLLALLTGSVLVLPLVLGGWMWDTGRQIFHNLTASLPQGYYLCRPYRQGAELPLQTLVQFVPTPDAAAVVARYAPQDPQTATWMKAIGAGPAEHVCVHGREVWRNGIFLTTRPLIDRYPALAQDACWTVGQGEVFVMGRHPYSYDSRYFGPIAVTDIHATCEALWTWETTP